MELTGVIQGTFFRGLPTFLAGKLTSIHNQAIQSNGIQNEGGTAK
jgi:dihydroorotase